MDDLICPNKFEFGVCRSVLFTRSRRLGAAPDWDHARLGTARLGSVIHRPAQPTRETRHPAKSLILVLNPLFVLKISLDIALEYDVPARSTLY